MGWALDGGEDIGGYMADLDTLAEEQGRMESIKADRKRRVRELSGKYVVATTGRSSGRTVFMQNRKVNNGGVWTQYLSNALGFITVDEAVMAAKKLKYGNPRVAVVTDGVYRWVK